MVKEARDEERSRTGGEEEPSSGGGEDGAAYWGEIGEQRQHVMTVRTRKARGDSSFAHVVTEAGTVLASPWFFAGLLLAHVVWVLLNLGTFGVEPWDPYPFPFLAMIASVEAPFLALLILMRQLRDARIAELREESDLQVTLHAERQTTKLLRLMEQVHATLVPESTERDEELERMKEPLDPHRLLEILEREVKKSGAE